MLTTEQRHSPAVSPIDPRPACKRFHVHLFSRKPFDVGRPKRYVLLFFQAKSSPVYGQERAAGPQNHLSCIMNKEL